MNKIEKSKTNFVKYIFFEQKYIDKFHDISKKILDTHWSGFDEACQLNRTGFVGDFFI